MDRQKEFTKIFESVCRRRSGWEVWNDMVWIFAITISNTVDVRRREAREAQYMRIIKKYDAEEVQAFVQMFAEVVMALEENPDRDFMGELFMRLELGNKWRGQFFTPYSVCEMMADITIRDKIDQIERQWYIGVNDCACGAGATLIAAANALRKRGINYQNHVVFVGQDVDAMSGLMCYIQLSLLGCAGWVYIDNTITNPSHGHLLFGDNDDKTWYMPMFYADVWEMRRRIAKVMAVLGERKSEVDPEPMVDVTVVESTKKRNAGQYMSDLGGG